MIKHAGEVWRTRQSQSPMAWAPTSVTQPAWVHDAAAPNILYRDPVAELLRKPQRSSRQEAPWPRVPQVRLDEVVPRDAIPVRKDEIVRRRGEYRAVQNLVLAEATVLVPDVLEIDTRLSPHPIDELACLRARAVICHYQLEVLP